MAVAKVVHLQFRRQVMLQDARVNAVYFPLTCMFSLLVTTDARPPMEVATFGREGVVGASEVFQAQGALGLNIIQIPGTAVRIPAKAFKGLLHRPMVQQLVHQYVYVLLRQILYGAGCRRQHSMEERCARWLLITHDSAGHHTFPLTQEFLSYMLGVRRATVNAATGMLKKAGSIRYVRGNLTVLDRAGLESASCGCYRAIIKLYSCGVDEG